MQVMVEMEFQISSALHTEVHGSKLAPGHFRWAPIGLCVYKPSVCFEHSTNYEVQLTFKFIKLENWDLLTKGSSNHEAKTQDSAEA